MCRSAHILVAPLGAILPQNFFPSLTPSRVTAAREAHNLQVPVQFGGRLPASQILSLSRGTFLGLLRRREQCLVEDFAPGRYGVTSREIRHWGEPRAGVAQWQSEGLISPRSQVRSLPPVPIPARVRSFLSVVLKNDLRTKKFLGPVV